MERLLAAMESPVDGGLHTVGHQERVRIGARRELAGRTSRHVGRVPPRRWTARSGGAPGRSGVKAARIAVRALENCRRAWFAGPGRRGCWWRSCCSTPGCGPASTYLFGYGFEDGTGGASDEYVRGFSFGGGQYVLQVGFDESALPVRCRRFAQASAGSVRGAREDLTDAHRTVHLVEEGVRPGLIGIDWDWE
ncbi:hypothetical protein SCALM49S_05135 [Streptomyces californicus]